MSTITIAIGCLAVLLTACHSESHRFAMMPPPDPQIDFLIAHINDNPDLLHSDYTPAVSDLVRIGKRALPRVLPLVESNDTATRMRAIHVLEIVTMEMHGFVWGQGWKTPDEEQQWRRFWQSLGDLRYDASLAGRRRSIRLWQDWLGSTQALSPNMMIGCTAVTAPKLKKARATTPHGR